MEDLLTTSPTKLKLRSSKHHIKQTSSTSTTTNNNNNGGCYKKFYHKINKNTKQINLIIFDKIYNNKKKKNNHEIHLANKNKKVNKQLNNVVLNNYPKKFKLNGKYASDLIDQFKCSGNSKFINQTKLKLPIINNNNNVISDGGQVDTQIDCYGDHLLNWEPNYTVTRRTAQIFREVYTAWQKRVGISSCISCEQIQSLFNDLQLFPSKSQVYEMLECAKECTGRPTPSYLTFGEFCVFATELKRCYDRGIPRPTQLSRLLEKESKQKKSKCCSLAKNLCKYEVFLGGSCNPTTWRRDVAIPMLKNMDISYYNPQVSCWKPELLEIEHHAKQNASVMFFVLDNQTRGVSALIEVAHIAGKRRKLILVVQSYTQQRQAICGEVISDSEYEELRNGQEVLQDLVERLGIPVFENISVALNCTAKVLRQNLNVQDLGLNDYAQPVKLAHVQLGQKLIKLKEAFDAVDTANSGELCLSDACLAFRILTNHTMSYKDLQNILASHTDITLNDISMENTRINFEQFCSIVAEFQASQEKWALPIRPLRTEPISPLENGRASCVRDVYLGGTCEGTTWREDIAIPVLKKHGLSYFNPRVCEWSKRLLPIEAAAMDNSHVLLFVITNTARSPAAMAVAGHYIGLGCNMVLCVEMLPEDAVVAGERLTPLAIKDYNRGRLYLIDLAKRDGIPVFNSISEAVECATHKCTQRSVVVHKRTGYQCLQQSKNNLLTMSGMILRMAAVL